MMMSRRNFHLIWYLIKTQQIKIFVRFFHVLIIIFFSQGKLLREKESKKGDWKQKISKGIKNAGETLKKHANKVSFRVQKWWKGFKASRSKGSKAEL